MTKLLALRGISGSGKSTYSEELRQQGWVVVSRDTIRESMFKDYATVDEDLVTVVEDAAIDAALSRGHRTVIDDTNIRLKYLKRFAELAAKHNASFDVKQFDVDVDEAIGRVVRRAQAGGRNVSAEVIKKQHKGLRAAKVDMAELYTPAFEPYVAPEESYTESAILVDIDGTLAHNNGHRNFYDYSLVGDDEVVDAVAEVVRRFSQDHIIIVMSGRDDSCQVDTEAWFIKHDIPWDYMFMRKTGDQRKDSVVKIELFDKHVRDKCDVKFVLDDRPSVCRAWRSIGLRVFQVGDPHVEF